MSTERHERHEHAPSFMLIGDLYIAPAHPLTYIIQSNIQLIRSSYKIQIWKILEIQVQSKFQNIIILWSNQTSNDRILIDVYIIHDIIR